MFSLLLLAYLPYVYGLMGYDCSSSGETVRYGLRVIEDCQREKGERLNSREWEGTILQVPNKVFRDHQTCRLILKKQTMYCTYHHNPTQLDLLDDDFFPTPYLISEQDCATAWATGVFSYHGEIFHVKKEGVTKLLIGANVDDQGFCKSSQETSTVLKGQLELIWGRVTEYYDIRGTTKARSLDGSPLTWSASFNSSATADGIVVLSLSPRTISCNWKSLYKGKGLAITTTTKRKYILIQELGNGFEVKRLENICRLRVWTTTDSSIFIVDSVEVDITLADLTFEGKVSSLITAGQIGASLFSHMSAEQAELALFDNQCVLEHMIQASIISMAAHNPLEAAHSLTGEQGWTLIPSGSSVVLKRCRDVEVVVTPQVECYADIPVTLRNSSLLMYLDPMTNVIKSKSYSIPCSDNILPTFRYSDVTYQLNPGPHQVPKFRDLPSRLSQADISIASFGGALVPDEVLANMDVKSEHTTIREEVSKQTLRTGDGSSTKDNNKSGLTDNSEERGKDSVPGYRLILVGLVIAIAALGFTILMWGMLWRSGFLTAMLRRDQTAEVQAYLLGRMTGIRSSVREDMV